MTTMMLNKIQILIRCFRAFLALFIVLFSGVILADPVGNFRYPTDGHSFDGNMLFSARVENPDGLGRVVIRFNNNPDSELLVCNCGNDTSKSFTDAGIKPRTLGLDIGSHTAQLITNNGANVVDTVSFSWEPPEITGIQVNRNFGSFSISWSALSGYSRYNLYIASVPNISPEDVDSLPDSLSFRSLRTTNQTINGVDDELGLFGLVTGTDQSGESAFSQIFRIEGLDNQDPIIGSDSFTLNEDSSFTGNVLNNDSDPENQTLTASLVTRTTNGSVSLTSNGAFTYNPNTNFNGADQFTYTANDPQGGSQLGTVTLTVSPVNDLPVARNDNYDASEDTPLQIDSEAGILSNDSDIDGDNLSANVVSTTQNGSLTLNSSGSFSYVPNAEFSGSDSFNYQISDGNGGTATASVTIAVSAVNDAPVANNDNYQTSEDNNLAVNTENGLLSNDSDADAQPGNLANELSVFLVSDTDNGNLNLSDDGSFTYAPDDNFFGEDSFTYQVIDSGGLTDSATVTIVVASVNDAPIATNDVYRVNEDSELTVNAASGVLVNDTDVDGDPLTVNVLNSTQNGTLSLDASGSFSYIPEAEFSGTDSFTYQVTDSNGGNDTASVTITINSVNDAPVANNDNYQTDEDNTLTISAENGVLSNDSDVDRDDELQVSTVTEPGNGTLTLSENGALTFTPNANFFGEVGFDYQVTDSSGATDTATVTIAVTPVNDIPVAVNDDYTLEEDSTLTVNATSGLLVNDSDVEDANNQLRARLITGAQNGEISVLSDGGFTYTPKANFFGTDTITYQVTDTDSGTATAIATFTISPVREAPIANDDVYQMNEDESLFVNDPTTGLLANDSDADINDNDKFSQLTVTLLSQPTSGNLNLAANGTFTYSPVLNFFGTVTFRYQVSDPEGQTDSANVTIEIADVADIPITQADSYNVDEDMLMAVTEANGVLANDVDPAGGVLTVSLLTQPQSGTLNLSSDGSFTYQPNQDFNGNDSFIYLVQNSLGLTAQETVTLSVAPVNDAPVAIDDVLIVDESTRTQFLPLENDTDIDGDSLRIVDAIAQTGTLTLNETSITYTAPDDPGNDVISYTIADPDGVQASASINVTINNVDEAPVAVDDEASTNEDTPVTLTPMENDSDPDGDALTLLANTASNGTVLIEGESLIFTPNENFNGTARVSYFIKDPAGNMDTGNIVIDVAPVNDTPDAVDDEIFVAERESVTFDPRNNDSDVDGDTLSITAVAITSPDNIQAELSFTNENVTFTAPASPGLVTLSYTISDGNGATGSAVIQINITNVDDAPVTQNDDALVDEDTPITLFPLENDSDPDGDELTISLQSVTNGTATLASSTSILFTPEENFNGIATISYQATDPGGNSATGTITITVNAVNDAPISVDDEVTVTESSVTELTPLDNDSDVDGDTLSITQATAANGSLIFNNTGITYTAPDVPGTDTINYTISDPTGATSAASINVTISDIQDVPVAVDDIASTNEDTAVQILPLNNDSDEDGDALTISIDSVSSGTASLDNNIVTYSPSANFNGIATISYTITDTANNSDSAIITITVNAVNDSPVAVNDAVVTGEDTAVQIAPLDNDSDVDGDVLALEVLQVSSGTALVTNNIINYTPLQNFNGTATISYQISDPFGATDNATITITVSAINDAPVAVNDTATTDEDTAVQISPLSNDSDADNDALTIEITSVSTGTASVSSNVVTYTPASNFNGTATINYQVSDNAGGSATASITVTVNAVNDAPIAVNDTATTSEDTSVEIFPLSNDSDVDNDTLTLSIVSISSGEATVNGDVVSYTPESNFNGVATVNYQISDPSSASDTGTVTITVTAVNDPPIAVNDSAITAEDTPVQIAPLTNDSDADNDALTVSIISVSSGTANVSNDIVNYTPSANFNGTSSISYRISDPSGSTATATITVTVTAVNDNPTAVDDTASTNEDTPVDIKPLDNDSDVDGDNLSFVIGSVTNGSASTPANDTITFTPTANFNGAATIPYTVSDGSGGTASATVTVNVVAVNDPPVAVNDTTSVNEGASVSITPLSNDSDPDGDNLTVTNATTTTGTVSVNTDATTLTYTAPTGFAGNAIITYTVTDTQASATGTITVTVNDINHAPVAVNDSYSVNAGETATLSVLSNDTDTDNDTLTITQASAAQGTVTISTDALSLSYVAPSDVTTTDTVSYTITDPAGATSSALATVSITEQAFSGEFDPDGDGKTDVTATENGSDYTVTFGSNVGAVYYDDNGSTVAVTTNDDGVHELTIQGTGSVNTLVGTLRNDLVTLGGNPTPLANHILPSGTNQVKFTINGNEHGFRVSNLDQTKANVAFIPPRPLNTGFDANTSFDFFLRYPSFTGPVRLGLDNGEHYVLNTGGTGTIQGTDFDFDIAWQEAKTQLVVTVLNSVEESKMMSVYELDDDNSDGIALGIITRAEADAYVSATSTNMVQVFTKEAREEFTFIRDHQLYIDAKSERFQSYRIDSGANPTITSATTAVIGAAPAETQDVELWDISLLKVNPITFGDIGSGIATYIPRISNNQFEDLVADTCQFTEVTTGANAGSGSCAFSSQSFSWSITNNILRVDFGSNVVVDYRWLDDLAFENTFSMEIIVGSGASQEGYSAYVYWLPVSNLTDSQINTFITNNYLDSALTKTDPAARMSDGSINTLDLSGFYFANNGLAKNLDSVTNFFGTEIIDTDRKWSINNGLLTLQSLSSFSSGGMFSFVYDQCTNSNDANCFVWQFRELFPIAIDGNKLWVWETMLQNQDGFAFNGSVNYQEIIPPRIQFYELNSTIPGAPNSINFNREPVWSKIELVTDENVPLNNVSLTSFFQDPESDTIVLTQVGVDAGTGTITLNDNQTISYTPAAGFIGTTNLYIDATDGVNEVFSGGLITVRSINQAPVANNDTATALSGFPNLIDPLSNDTDPNNDALTISLATPGTGQGTVAIVNDTLLEYTPPNTFTGEASINYTINDGRGSTASATITITVSQPVFDGSFDLDNSSEADFTINNNGGTFTVTFGGEVSAAYYTLNGQKFVLSKNASGSFIFDYAANTSPIPVLTYVINGVEYSFAPDDLSQTTPNLIFSGFVAPVNDLGTRTSYQLIARQPAHSSALTTGHENGALYDLQSGGSGQYSSPTITDSVTWSNSNGDIEINFTNPQEQQLFYNVYDLDDDMSDGNGMGIITKAEADAYVAANNTNVIDVYVSNTAHRIESLGLFGYFFNVLVHETQRFRIDSTAHPQVTSAQSGVSVSFGGLPLELLDTSKFNFLAFSASELTNSSVYLPIPFFNSRFTNNFETEQCNFTEASSGSNAGTGSCVNSSQTFSWSITSDNALNMTFDAGPSLQLSTSYRKLNSGAVENTVFVKSSLTNTVTPVDQNIISDTSISNNVNADLVYSTLEYWYVSQPLTSSAVSTLLSGSYFETSDNVSYPFNYDAQGQLNSSIAKGFYLNTDGLAKDILATLDTNNNTVYTDNDLRWAVDANSGNVSITAQTNLLSSDTYRYIYSQCVITTDPTCFPWQVRSWVPLAIEGSRLWVLDTEQRDNDPFDTFSNYELSEPARIRFYEVRTPVPGAPNSISFNQEPVFSNSTNFTATQNTPVTISVLNHIIDPENDTITINSGTVSNGDLTVNSDSTITYTPNTGFTGAELLVLNVSDGTNTADIFTAIIVSTANNAPVANNDTFVATRGRTNFISPLDNDTDADNDILLITNAVATNGTAVRANGDLNIDYTAPGTGTADTINYDINDGRGGTASAVISVTINDDPIANADNYNTPVDRTITIPALSNDTDVNGDPLSIVQATVDIGTVFIINNGQALSFIAPNSPTISTINYDIDDGKGGFSTSTVTVTVIPNSPPTATSDTGTVSEGGTVTLTPLANDTDSNGDSLTISQASSSDGQVTVAADKLSLDFAPSITTGTAIINYIADDGFGGTSSSTISVTVVSNNSTPTDILLDGLSAISVPRNTTGTNFTVGSLTTIDADTGNSHSYSLVNTGTSNVGTCTSDTHNGNFSISGNSLRSQSKLLPATYQICVQTNDSIITYQKTLTITVLNNNPTDVLLDGLSAITVTRNSTGTNFTVGSLTTTDADNGDSHSYSLVNIGASSLGTCSSSANNGNFSVSGNSLRSQSKLLPGTYQICVQTNDTSITYQKTLAVTVTNNDPTDLLVNNLSAITVIRNSTGTNFTVGSLSTTDGDAGDSHTYSLVNTGASNLGTCTSDTHNGNFSISGISLRSQSKLLPATYEICVQTDDTSTTFQKTLSVTVTNSDPTDLFVNGQSAITVARNTTGVNFTLGSLSTTDTDAGDNHNYSLVNTGASNLGTCSSSANNGNFRISGGSLQSQTKLVPGTYQICVQTDDTSTTFQKTLSVTVTNNDPTDVLLDGQSAITVARNTTGVNFTVGSLTTTDADGGDIHAYSLVTMNSSTLGACSTDSGNSNFRISGSSLQSLTKLAPATYEVCVQTDDTSTTYQKTLSITVTNSNPTDILIDNGSSVTVTRNSTGINFTMGSLSTTDTDAGDNHSYSLVAMNTSTLGACTSASGNGSFNISGNSLRSRTSLVPADYEVCVQTDDTSTTFQKTLTITVSNNAPNDITLSSNSINDSVTGENVSVGTLNTADADGGDTHTYALVTMGTSTNGGCTADSGNTSFNINGNSLRTANTLTAGTYNVCVQSSDGNASFEKDFTITVISTNNAPLAVNDTITVLPLSSGNTIDVLANDSDPDNGDTIAIFSASNTSTGVVTVANDNLSLSYDAPSTERTDTITYTIQDNHGAQATATVAVTMNNNPTATATSGFIATSASKTFTPSVTDPNGDTFTVTAASVTSGNVSGSVGSFSGSSITFNSTAVEGTAVISYTVQDSYGGTDTSTITVTVNAAPTVAGETYTFDSTSAISMPAVSGVLANDSDPNNETLTVSLLSGPGHSSAFSLNSDGSFNYTHDNMSILTDGFSYTVSDGTHTVNGYANINIVKENFAPELCAAPPAYATVGEAFGHTFTGSDSGSMSLSGTGLTNNPAWLTISQTDSSTFAITGTPTSSDIGKTSNIQATITDGIDTASITFDLTVMSEFGTGNLAQLNLFNNSTVLEAVKDIAIDNKGRIVIVGESNLDIFVARFLPDGSLDNSFDTNGIYTLDLGGIDSALAVDIRDDNGIVIANQTSLGNINWELVALNENGSFDTNFGTNGRLLQTDFSGTADETITDVIVRDDGRIIVVGTHLPSTGQEGFIVARYLADGTPDNSFNSNGYIIHTHTTTSIDLLATASMLDQDGAIYIGGYTIGSATNDMYLIKLTDSGLATNWNTTGIFTLDDSGNEQLYDMVFDATGDILLAGEKDTDMAVYRLGVQQTTGNYLVSRDNTYSDGDSDDDRFTFNGGGNEVVHRIISDGFGNFYIVGKDGNSNTIAIKLSGNGIKDTSFGSGGVKTISLLVPPVGEEAVATLFHGQLLFADADVINSATDSIVQLYRKHITSLTTFGNNCSVISDFETQSNRTDDNLITGVFASDNSIYLVGYGTELGKNRTTPTPTFEDFLVAKVNSSGNLVSDFGSNGTLRFDGGSTKSFSVTDATTMASDSLLIVGKDGSTSSFAQLFLARITAAGELDSSFGTGGLLDLTGSVQLDDAEAAYVSGSNQFLLAGKGENASSNPVHRIYRYNNDGSADNTFGMGSNTSSLDNSVNYTDYEDTYYSASGIEVLSNGDIYFVGYTAASPSFYGEVTLVKHNSSGLRDNLFGSSGVLTLSTGGDYTVKASANDGTNIYVLAQNLLGSGMEVLKFNLAAEALDTTFGTGGMVTLSNYINNNYPDIAVDSSGKIWLSTKHSSNGDSLVRLDSKGNFDGVFLNAGQSPLTHQIEMWDEIRGIALNSNNEAAIFGTDGSTLNTQQRNDFKLAFTNNAGVVSNSASQITVDLGSGEHIKDIALGNEGHVYLAGSGVDDTDFIESFMVAKYDDTGNGDASFGSHGQSNTPIERFNLSAQTVYSGLALSNSNDLFLSGEFKDVTLSHKDVFVMKVEPESASQDNGNTFPYGATDINTRTGNGAAGSNDLASGQYLADDGSLYVVGSRDGIAVVVKYTPASNAALIDTSFGSSGELRLSGHTTSSHLNDITMGPQGALVAVGYSDNAGNRNGLVIQFSNTGTLHEGFNSNGVIEFSATGGNEQFETVSLDPNGNVIAAGYADNDALVAMYTGAGALNNSFDSNGYKTFNLGSTLAAQEVFVDSQLDAFGGLMLAAQIENKFRLMRIDNTGTTLFDSGAQSLGVYNKIQALAIDKLGSVYVAGSAQVDGSYNWQLVVVRFPNVVGSF